MRFHRSFGWFLPVVLVAAGCGYFSSNSASVETVEDNSTRLGNQIDISLADWLALPRAELAKLADEHAQTLARQQEASQHSPDAVSLLPRLNLSIKAPIFDKASFDATTGISLPPYVKSGQRDAAVALHLARYGDLEAAMKLADPADVVLVQKLKSLAAEKDYPVEWTRLVAFCFYNAQLKLAAGEVEGATELVQLHKQLQSILDAKSASGPLGAVLLPMGKRALVQAANHWGLTKYNKKALADDVTAAVAEWGELPAPQPALTPATSAAAVAGWLGAPVKGKTAAVSGNGVLRALDLLDLPLVDEGVDAVIAFFENDTKWNHLLFVYRPKINQRFPEPADLAQILEDVGATAAEPTPAEGIQRQVFSASGLSFDINLFTRTTRLGAFIRIGEPATLAAAKPAPKLARDFGIAQLDHSFAHNRLTLGPELQGDKVTVDKTAVLAKTVMPAKDLMPTSLVVERHATQPLVESLTFHWSAENNVAFLTRLLLPMWSAFGPSKFGAAGDDSGSHFELIWQDAQTHYTLRLPNDDQKGTDLIVADARGSEGIKARLATVAANDDAARKSRLEAKTPHKRLPRALQLENIHLGMARSKALATLPRGQLVRQMPLADGVSMMFLTAPDNNSTYNARQMFVRFGPGDKVAEIRVRYQIGPRQPDKDHKSLPEVLKSGPSGAPDSQPARWANLWTDLPLQRPAAEMLRWVDDITVMTYERDAGGAEVTLRDADAADPLGVELPPLRFCSRGIDACNLGDNKSDILRRWKINSTQTTADGAIFFGQPESSPYDMVLVWFEDGKASRIVARHKLKDGKPLRTDQVSTLLQETWSDPDWFLGMLRRQNGEWGQIHGTYGWHDDKTRIVTHVQDTEPNGPRAFTEWREWPLPDKTVVSGQ